MEFRTTSIPLAAYLTAAEKLELLRIEATPKTATFVFADPHQEGSTLELSFLSGSALVSATTYNTKLRALRRSAEIRLAEARTVEGVERE